MAPSGNAGNGTLSPDTLPGTLPGTLFVVAMPIGNPDDCSPRARAVLSRAGLILAEDTRRAGLTLQRLGVERSGELLSFFEHNEEARLERVLQALRSGVEAALISDAGTPLLSDPGFKLVAACREQGLPVTPLPGPSAALAALSACGLPPQPFTFLGFPPRKAGQMKALLARHRDTGATLIFYERADRIMQSLTLMAEVLGPRPVSLARELTKTHEEFVSGDLGDLTPFDREFKGEATLVVGPGGDDERDSEDAVRAVADEERAAGGKPRQVAKRVAARVRGWTADQVYESILR